MPRIVETLKSYVIRRRYKFRFRVRGRERLCRHEFFYNAFRALSFNGIDGDYAEFGCYRAMTFAMAYQEAVRHKHKARLWAFDSFSGLPAPKDDRDSHPKWVEKGMATSLDRFHDLCALQRVPRDAYEVVPGFYEETLPAMSDTDAPPNTAMVYIDCDLYSSTGDVLRFLMPRLKHGMIIAFDDYFGWSATQVSGNRRAMLEVFSENSEWELVPYMQYGWHGQSFVVESRKIVRSSS